MTEECGVDFDGERRGLRQVGWPTTNCNRVRISDAHAGRLRNLRNQSPTDVSNFRNVEKEIRRLEHSGGGLSVIKLGIAEQRLQAARWRVLQVGPCNGLAYRAGKIGEGGNGRDKYCICRQADLQRDRGGPGGKNKPPKGLVSFGANAVQCSACGGQVEWGLGGRE